MGITKRQFFASLAALLLILLAVNVAVAIATRNSVPRRVMAHARQSPGAIVVALGNSLVGAGFDEAAFDRGMNLQPDRGAVNLALGASTPVEQLLLLRYALRDRIRPRLIVYGFYDLQLSAPISLTTADLVGNRAVLYYLEPEYARAFYHLSFHDRIEFEAMRHFPMTVDRGAIWAKVERVRRTVSQEGMPEEESNRFGRVADFALLEASSAAEFSAQCDAAASQELIAPVREITRQGRQAGADVVVVEMPMPPEHLRTFYETPAWERYAAHVRSLVVAEGGNFLDASNWERDASMFADHLHLTEEGAMRFSQTLGQRLRDTVKLDAEK